MRKLVQTLRDLKVWCEDLSYAEIVRRINARRAHAGRPEQISKATVGDCFDRGRRRLDEDLVVEVAEALHPEPEYLALWRSALRSVRSRVQEAAVVDVRPSLPDGPADFVGREHELDVIQDRAARDRPGALAIVGMAGVGKTSLAIQAGRAIAERPGFARVLFADLRGVTGDPSSPPADPAAVLDALLRLLGDTSPRRPATTAAAMTARSRCGCSPTAATSSAPPGRWSSTGSTGCWSSW